MAPTIETFKSEGALTRRACQDRSGHLAEQDQECLLHRMAKR